MLRRRNIITPEINAHYATGDGKINNLQNIQQYSYKLFTNGDLAQDMVIEDQAHV